MSEFSGFGRVLMIVGILLFSAGLALWIGDRFPFSGRLPGDIVVRREGFRLYFPIVTCIVVSIVLRSRLKIPSGLRTAAKAPVGVGQTHPYRQIWAGFPALTATFSLVLGNSPVILKRLLTLVLNLISRR